MKNLNNIILTNDNRIKSTDLVEIINEFRKLEKNKTELLHKNLMEKIRKEIETLKKLRINAELNFQPGSYKDKNSQERPCYLVNKNGMLQMLNSESALVRYKTIEYIEKLEEENNKLKEISKPDSYMIDDPIERAKRWIEEREQYNKVVKELEDKNSFIGKISASENSLLVREVAKLASKGNITIGEKALWNKLREWGYISQKSTEPMQSAINAGWFEVIERVVERSGKSLIYKTTKVTGKGQIHIIKKLSKEFENKLKKIQ